MAVEFLDAPDITEANDIPEAPEMSNVDLAKNLARAIGQGVLFGFADEAEGYARSILGDETYTEARDSARAGLEQFRTESPYLAYGAEIASSIPTAMVGGAGLTAARLAGKVPQAMALGASGVTENHSGYNRAS